MSNKVYIISEIGINHNGDLGLAKELIYKSKNAGADAVKFQKRTINLVYTEAELNNYRESPWGLTNGEQKEGLEFDIEQYEELEKFVNELGMDFIVSCWDLQSIDLVEKHLNVRYQKIASALATNKEFLEKLNECGKPTILSTGMCTEKQIEASMNVLDNVEYVLACTSTYPTEAEEINLLHITTLKNAYPNVKVGFSNHYSGLDACIGAVVLGAKSIEFHITKDRAMYGSDQSASIEDAKGLIDGIRSMEKMIGDGVKRVYETEKPIISKLRKINNV